MISKMIDGQEVLMSGTSETLIAQSVAESVNALGEKVALEDMEEDFTYDDSKIVYLSAKRIGNLIQIGLRTNNVSITDGTQLLSTTKHKPIFYMGAPVYSWSSGKMIPASALNANPDGTFVYYGDTISTSMFITLVYLSKTE